MNAERKEPRPGYWAVIPSAVRYDDQLPASAKVLYAELSALAEASGYCWAENSYFARVFRMTEKSIREQLHALEAAGYIRIEEQRGRHNVLMERRIYVGLNPLLAAPAPESLNEKVLSLNEKVQRHDINNNNNIPPISPKSDGKRQRSTAEVDAAILAAAGDDEALRKAWADFAAFRRELGRPIKTPRTVQLLARTLEQLSGGDKALKIAILEQSQERSWTGLFALKDQARNTPTGAAGVKGGYVGTHDGGDKIPWI